MSTTTNHFAFHRARRVVFASSCVLSLVWTVLLAVYLAKEWREYDTGQKIIVTSLVVVKGITSILSYLLAVVQFRLLVDAAWVGFLLLVQLCSTLPYTIFYTEFPCTSFGSETMCTRMGLAINIGCWALNGLLFGYGLCLLATICISQTSPSILESSQPPPTTKETGRRHHRSQSSVDSQTHLLIKDNISVPRSPSTPASPPTISTPQMQTRQSRVYTRPGYTPQAVRKQSTTATPPQSPPAPRVYPYHLPRRALQSATLPPTRKSSQAEPLSPPVARVQPPPRLRASTPPLPRATPALTPPISPRSERASMPLAKGKPFAVPSSTALMLTFGGPSSPSSASSPSAPTPPSTPGILRPGPYTTTPSKQNSSNSSMSVPNSPHPNAVTPGRTPIASTLRDLPDVLLLPPLPPPPPIPKAAIASRSPRRSRTSSLSRVSKDAFEMGGRVDNIRSKRHTSASMLVDVEKGLSRL